ncbi:MAG TPA: hypothetical protein VKZ94_07120 [Advenella sp.]|nr:hypothetical protein [Advenella sp.]
MFCSSAIYAQTSNSTVNLMDLTQGDPFFYTSDQNVGKDDKQQSLIGQGRPRTTHSKIPHLPVYFGYFNTNYTYRFVTIAEQVFTMIGEGKHGLWRVQEKGTVRAYLKKGMQGLAPGADLNAPENQDIIKGHYSAYLPEESWDGYKYPDQQLNQNNNLNFIDLPITHPVFNQKYADHEQIDLPNFFCTMSGADFPYAQQALNFAFKQPGANKVGPLGKRAGLDIRENYTNVIRLSHLPDARSWVNTGQGDENPLHVRWQAIDTTKTDAEYYLVERPFFNKPYLFMVAVFDNKDNADFRYIRPDGGYFESIRHRAAAREKNEVTRQPRFHLEDGTVKKAIGLPLYGVHHPDRKSYGAGGACPMKGGDWGRYPATTGGSGWPTQYEEVTPMCDAVLVDIKFYTNLDGKRWDDENKYLANAGTGTKEMRYTMEPGEYGKFTDPYNTNRQVKNPDQQAIPEHLTVTYPSVSPPVSYVKAPAIDTSAMAPGKETTCRPVRH